MLMKLICWVAAYWYSENAEGLVVASTESGLSVSVDRTQYMVMSRDQSAGRSHGIKIDSSSFAIVEEFKYLGTILTNRNYIQEEMKIRLKSGKACYHFVQNLLSSKWLSKSINIKIHRTINLPVVLYGCET